MKKHYNGNKISVRELEGLGLSKNASNLLADSTPWEIRAHEDGTYTASGIFEEEWQNASEMLETLESFANEILGEE